MGWITMKLDDQELHNVAHMRYLTEHATDEAPEVCFDYTLTANVLEVIDRLLSNRNALIEECALAAHKAILDNGGSFELANDALGAIRALKDKT